MRDLLLARHAEATSSAAGVVDGDPGSGHGLTDRGRDQATALGRALAGRRIDLCVTSTFARAVETADLALAGVSPSPPRELWPVFDDARFGDFEGQPLGEYRQWILDHGAGAEPPGGGESRAATILRFCRGLEALADRSEPTVLVVAHGILVAAVTAAVDGSEPSLVVDQPAYGGVCEVPADALLPARGVLWAWATAAVPT